MLLGFILKTNPYSLVFTIITVPPMLKVVLHPDTYKFLCEITDASFQQRVWNCIDKLRNQQLTGGLRAKRLQGVVKRVWEARINRASRLIFTYNKSKVTETGQVETFIAIQDICWDHDDVTRWVARERTPDANWLDAKIDHVIGNIDAELKVLSQSERAELEWAQLEDEDLAISSSCEDELLSNIQWRVIESAEDWHKAIINKDGDLQLKLTSEEYTLATQKGDLLIKGSA